MNPVAGPVLRAPALVQGRTASVAPSASSAPRCDSGDSKDTGIKGNGMKYPNIEHSDTKDSDVDKKGT